VICIIDDKGNKHVGAQTLLSLERCSV